MLAIEPHCVRTIHRLRTDAKRTTMRSIGDKSDRNNGDVQKAESTCADDVTTTTTNPAHWRDHEYGKSKNLALYLRRSRKRNANRQKILRHIQLPNSNRSQGGHGGIAATGSRHVPA